MNIQTKALAIIISSFILLTVTLSLTLLKISTDNYLQLEQDNVKEHLQRLVNIINLKQNDLQQFTGDWAIWDDSYQFIKNQNPEFIKSNFTAETFTTTNLAFIAYINRAGEIVYGSSFNQNTEQMTPLFSNLMPYLSPGAKLLEPVAPFEATCSLISIPEGNFMVASYPIHTSNAKGPSPGVVIIGKRLDQAFASDISDIIKLDFEIFSINNSLPAQQKNILQKLNNDNQYTTDVLSNQVISGYTFLNDTNNNPAILLQLYVDRAIYLQGKKSRQQMIWSIIAVASLLTAVLIYLIRTLILGRLSKLSSQVSNIQHSKNLDKRLNESSKDEIGILATNINNMLEAIQQVNQNLEIAKNSSEQANKAKTEFLSRMNHELRTPLSAILGFSEVLQTEFEQTGPDHVKKDIHRIREAGKYLLSLINQLLDLSAIEHGKHKLEITHVNVGESIRNCVSLLSPLANEKGISLIDTTKQYDQFFANADHNALNQIIINLVNNAIKFNKENGNVCIEYKHTQDNQISINIKDTGSGIPAEFYETIFEPFTRLKTAKKVEGSGIGLAITKSLVELMGGHIVVISEPDNGCCFSFTLPADKAA